MLGFRLRSPRVILSERSESNCIAAPSGATVESRGENFAQDDTDEKAPSNAKAGSRAKRRTMYYVYILTNKTDAVMYIGVTNDLRRRLYEHKNEQIEGFTKKYHVHKLVYFEEYSEVNDAIAREKQLKRWVRSKKNWLVETKNPNWDDWGEGFI